MALAIIGSVAVVLAAAARIPAAAAAFLRACIPLIEAIHEVREALLLRRSRKSVSQSPGEE